MSGDGYASKVQDLLPRIRERREEIEQARRLPRDLVDQLIESKVFRLALPRAVGGEELDPVDQARLIETISSADGSTGWCVMIALGNGVFGGCMPEVGAKEVFADPTLPTGAALAPSGNATCVEGGFIVSGHWRFASGIDHVDWVLGGCVVMDNGAPRTTPSGLPELVHAFMPVADVDVHDTWFVSGLKGTGSKDYSSNDVFVPTERIVAVFDRTQHRPEPLYQLPIIALFAPQVAAVGLGIARTALDELAALATEKTPTFSTARMAAKPITQIEIARAEAKLGGARCLLYESLDDLWQTVLADREPTKRQLAMCRIAAINASETSAELTRSMSVLAGGTSIYSSSSLQRHARDAEAITHHVTQSPQVWEECGRVLFGLDPLFPIF